ncbi:MAG TPA: type VI secretion system baseplate subunit TssE [Thermoanaerobaculia bacterium]|nr:type VI secretion system baseplate subunit TssE [Thermoanaerobaculia bacterium]
MPRPRGEAAGFLEKMLGPFGGRPAAAIRWVGDPVRTHLALLLNTRRGAVRSLPDYGLPDVASFYSDYPASLAELRLLIEKLIKKYEPRLLNARVRLMETDTREFRAVFLISGEIEQEEDRVRVQYRTTISSTGQAALGTPYDD